jgi:hypothetical protein
LLKEHDWLFKTLVYGSYLDFNLITRLKKYYSSIKKIISDETKFISGTGIQYSKEPIYDSKHLINYSFIDAHAVEQYFINPDKIEKFTKEKVHRIRDQRIFKSPMLLIRKGPDTKLLVPKSAIYKKDAVFKDTLTAVKVFSKSNINILRNIEAVLNSDIYAYFSINTFASIAIEREQIQNYDKFSVPYVESDINLVETIEEAKKELHHLQKKNYFDDFKCSQIQQTIYDTQNKINNAILYALNFNEIELSLLDYALNINRPLITRTEKNKYDVLEELQKPLEKYSDVLISYANVFLNRFKRNINNDEQKFVVRINHTRQLLGMFFEVVPIDTQEENGIVWEDVTDKQIMSLLIKLSSEKITDKLFVLKDIRGFEKERFYIFKPNEKRLWHKAIAYLDAEEFMDAILRAGSKGK